MYRMHSVMMATDGGSEGGTLVPPGAPGSTSVRVFVLDDHEVVRAGVRALLEETGVFDVVGEGSTVPEGLRGIMRTQPDVAIVDVRLPGGNGIELIREIRSRRPETRCVILTSFPDEDAFYQSVVAGAAGYVVKDVAQEELAAAVQRVASGESLLRPEVVDDLKQRARRLPPDDEFLADLTAQERRILRFVAVGMTNREIAHELSLAEKTVRNYMSNVLSKLGMKNRTEVAAYVAQSAVRRGRSVARPPVDGGS